MGFAVDLGFAVGFAAVVVGSQLSFSAAQIRSQLPRSDLSSLSAVPDSVSAGEEKAVPPQIQSQLERRRRWDRAVGV